MRIVFLYGAADRYGASRVLEVDVRHLAIEHDVVVVLPFDGPLASRLVSAGAAVRIDPSLVVLRRVDGLRQRAPRAVPAECRGADLVVLWTLALGLYAPLLRLKRIRFGLSIHELLPSVAGAVLARVASFGASWVHVNSVAVQDWILESTGLLATVVYPSVSPRLGQALEPHSDRQSCLRLVLAGRTNGRKGHLAAIDATVLARRRGVAVTLDLFGDPFPGQQRAHDAVLDACRRHDEIVYCGAYDGEAPPFDEYDLVLALPTFPESFGLTPVEAWAAGTRSLGWAAGGLTEALVLADGIVATSATVSAVADAIEWVARHEGVLLQSPRRDAPAATLCTAERRARHWAPTVLT